MTEMYVRWAALRPWRLAAIALLGASAAMLLFIFAWFVVGLGVAAVSARLNPPGEMVDVGGRHLHIVCDGPKVGAVPTVLFESGAFGFSADWAVIQAKLTAMGVRSCAYDRAGLGFSDPGPAPRDGLHVAMDLESLLRAAKEPGPYILVSHSMAGLHVRLLADRNREWIVGLVLVDSTTPEAMDDPSTRNYVDGFTTGARAAAAAASLGLMQALRDTPLANKIGLTSEAEREKRHMFASGPYNRAAATEVEQWPTTAWQARRSGSLNPDWPVVVVMSAGLAPQMRDEQARPAEQSKQGYVDIVSGATHDNLLGPEHADAIVKAIVFVMDRAMVSSHGGSSAPATSRGKWPPSG